MCPGKEYQHELGIGTKIRYCEDILLFLLWVLMIGVVMKHTDRWSHVTLYGVEHSPWVQGIRLALAHHRISHHLTSVPVRVSHFWRNGPVFPVLQLGDQSIHIDSFRMYMLLEEHGYDMGMHGMSEEECFLMQMELEKLFSIYALGRCGNGKKWAFVQGWSTMRELPNRMSGIIFRALLTNYFWVLITMGILFVKSKKRIPYNMKAIEKKLEAWNQKLEGKMWLTGEKVGFVDFALFGHLQCMSSGLTDELFPVLQRQPQLLSWVQRMIDTQDGYTPMYVRRIADPSVPVACAGRKERFLFWVAWLGWMLLFPITLLFVVSCLRNRFRSPARTGAILEQNQQNRTQNKGE